MKKIAILALSLVLALGVLGIGYAKWSDTVTITGTVNTGTIDLAIADVGVTDLGPDPQCGVGDNHEGKDVAQTVSANGTKASCEGFYNYITETFTNVYPWYKAGFTIQLTNCGTVPVKVETVEARYRAGDCANPVDLAPWMVFSWIITDEFGNVTSGGPGTIYDFQHALGTPQIGHGAVITVTLNICFQEEIRINNETFILPQNACASYDIVITASQWNEVP